MLNAARVLAAVVLAGAMAAAPAQTTPTAHTARVTQVPAQPQATESADAERLYRDGVLSSGEALRGERADAAPLRGKDAACVQCHRRSGLGAVEGGFVVPPITGRFLFHPGQRFGSVSPEHSDSAHTLPSPRDRTAYDEATLARAIRDGVGVDGRPLNYLMPRFNLDDASMHGLVDYLRHLSSGRVPGVSEDTLRFATIVTPDADPAARDGMLNVLQQYFAEKNTFYRTAGVPQPQGTRAMPTQVHRQWQLLVWTLQGAPESWEAQLDQHLRREPVFAVVSGVGGATWEPVHRFCERQALPCLFPNVDLPAVGNGDFYSIYYSQGVLLEAQLVASRLVRKGGDGHGRIVQVFRKGDIGEVAAARLREAVARDWPVQDRPLALDAGGDEMAQAVAGAGVDDVLVLWLRPNDLAALPAKAAQASSVYVSGLMGGLERAPLPAAWRGAARLTYPLELPKARSLRLNYPLGWFRLRGIPVVDERVQVDTYVTCQVLLETLASMLDEFVRDYLVERVEVMLDSRIINGYYTRLGLAPGQRFASKGGYLVRFVGPTGTEVAADGDWIVP